MMLGNIVSEIRLAFVGLRLTIWMIECLMSKNITDQLLFNFVAKKAIFTTSM